MEDKSIIYPTAQTVSVDFVSLKQWSRMAESLGLDGLQLMLVVKLACDSGVLPGAEVREQLALPASDFSRLVNRAEDGELVLRVSGEDCRCVSLELLERGWDAAEEALEFCGALSNGVEADGEMLVSRALAANKQVRLVCRARSLTFTQALCLLAIGQLGMQAKEPSAATAVARITGVPRTSARAALSRLRACGILS